MQQAPTAAMGLGKPSEQRIYLYGISARTNQVSYHLHSPCLNKHKFKDILTNE